MAAMARRLLDAAPLCAIATVTRSAGAHINTAYFAWSAEFDIVWLSDPHARHSHNIRSRPTVAIAVYDSRQSWGQPDRGIQLLGSAAEAEGSAAGQAELLYAERFPDYRESDLSAYRFYRFRPRRLKLFDEDALGTGVFVTARIGARRGLVWERTDIYRPAADQD
jgi:uncharacterized protein YhbP (UPF0306 family)